MTIFASRLLVSVLKVAMASARTFDLKIIQKSGPEHNFTLIAQEEHKGIETLLKAKKVHVKNDMAGWRHDHDRS